MGGRCHEQTRDVRRRVMVAEPRRGVRSRLDLAPELEAGEALDADVFTGLGDRVLDQLLYRLRFVLDERLLQQADFLWVVLAARRDIVFRDVEGAGAGDMEGDLLREALEVIGAGHEVGLAVQLNKRPQAPVVMHIDLDHAFGSRALGAFGCGGVALLLEDLDGFVKVAVCLVERLFAVEHAGAGEFAQSLNVFGGIRHGKWFSCRLGMGQDAGSSGGGAGSGGAASATGSAGSSGGGAGFSGGAGAAAAAAGLGSSGEAM